MPKTTYRFFSWNVNGLRAIYRKDFLNWLEGIDAQWVALQETKIQEDQLEDTHRKPLGLSSYWSFAKRKGYSGVVTYTNKEPISQTSSFRNPEFDSEGRIVCLEYEKFYFFNVYFPNGKRDDERLDYKLRFYEWFQNLAQRYRKKKPVIICGDVNTAHREIDLARPKENVKISGFLPEERQWMDRFFAAGYLDTFRHLHPEASDRYSWWSLRAGSRQRNVGWRIDYFLVSEELEKNIVEAEIHDQVMGSDHCPISLTLRI